MKYDPKIHGFSFNNDKACQYIDNMSEFEKNKLLSPKKIVEIRQIADVVHNNILLDQIKSTFPLVAPLLQHIKDQGDTLLNTALLPVNIALRRAFLYSPNGVCHAMAILSEYYAKQGIDACQIPIEQCWGELYLLQCGSETIFEQIKNTFHVKTGSNKNTVDQLKQYLNKYDSAILCLWGSYQDRFSREIPVGHGIVAYELIPVKTSKYQYEIKFYDSNYPPPERERPRSLYFDYNYNIIDLESGFLWKKARIWDSKLFKLGI